LIYSHQTLDSAKSLIDSVGFFKIAHNSLFAATLIYFIAPIQPNLVDWRNWNFL